MIYLDYNSTSPVCDEVLSAITPLLKDAWGNPSSSYRFGSKLKGLLDQSRSDVANLIGCDPLEIIFTSGGTEGNNACLNAIISSNRDKRHIITSNVEHSAILNYCNYLETVGYKISRLPVDSAGMISIEDLKSTIREDTIGISLMWANNETGVVFPIKEIAQVVKSYGILFHCDAVQAIGREIINLKDVPVDYLTLSGHKIGSTKGIGAIFVRKKSFFTPLIIGGHQESGRRGGTESIPMTVGLGIAANRAARDFQLVTSRILTLREAFEAALKRELVEIEINGGYSRRLVNTSNIFFPGVSSEALLLLLDQKGICASSGSACLADSPDPSHVIAAMRSDNAPSQSIRFSFGYDNKESEVAVAVKSIVDCVKALKPR